MTAYGRCHKCGRDTGCDPGHGWARTEPVCPGFYSKPKLDGTGGIWQCYDCNWKPEPRGRARIDRIRQRATQAPKNLVARKPHESLTQWRRRMKREAEKRGGDS